jgi:hypothetical protein
VTTDLLSLWERGAGERRSRRALALLAGAWPGADVEELAAIAVGRRDASLLALREQLFGGAFTGVTACPACAEEIELTFDAAEVRRDAAEATSFRLDVDGLEIEARLPDTRDLARIEAMSDLAAARDVLLEACVVRAARDGVAVGAAELPPHVVAAVSARMAELDPQADVALDVTCPNCAHVWREPFDIATFLWTELSAAARRLLLEVHQLASAYGWSESEVLRLSPARRNAYIEMLA